MNDKELTALFVAQLGPLVRAQPGLEAVTFARNFQSRPQGVATGPIVYFFKVTEKRHGSPKRRDVINLDEEFDHSQLQLVEATWQFDAWIPQDPRIASELTESDVLSIVSGIIQTDTILQIFRDAGVGVQRVTEVRNPYIQDDRDRNEAIPSFDIVLTHYRTLVSTVPAAVTYEANTYRT